MTEPGTTTRVAVYLDFDNIVISRYDQVQRPQLVSARQGQGAGPGPGSAGRAATVDVGAIIDFASSFGTLVLTRAYADWSADVNAGYREQLVGRAVDLVQLFPAAAYGKNGADIRLAVDAVEDMFRLPDLTHVVIVAGDSDYIAAGAALQAARPLRGGHRGGRLVEPSRWPRRATTSSSTTRCPAFRRSSPIPRRPKSQQTRQRTQAA